jgi:acetyl esterase
MKSQKIKYKTTPQGDLHLYLFDSLSQSEKSGAIVYFICGGWQGFTPEKFFPQATYFASRGLRVFVTEVRSVTVHQTSVVECVIDGKSAIRWVREHASEFNIKPDSIIATGGSAAGHVSLCAALIDGFEEETENSSVSTKPNYLCLFNPVVNIFEKQKRMELFKEFASKLDPTLNLNDQLPPAIIMQGSEDQSTLLKSAQEFVNKCKQIAVHQPELIIYEKEAHGFNNWFDGKNDKFFETVRDMDLFLAKHKLIQGPPTIDRSFVWEGPNHMGTM